MKPEKKIMIFGTFDYFHAGHEDMLRQARAMGDYLIAIVARDKTVERIKGRLPDHTEKERLNVLKSHQLVNKAVLGNEVDKHKVVLQHKPHIIALGYDQFVFTYTLNKLIIDNGLETEIVRLQAYQPDVFKSSKIKARLSEENSVTSTL